MKSQAHIRSAWFFTKVAQLWPPPRLPRTSHMYFWIVRLLTLIPIFSSSPRMRSAPHKPAARRHVADQLDRRARQRRRLARARSAPPKPPEPGAMPTQNGLGLDQDDDAPPRRQPPRAEEQLQPIHDIEPGSLAATSQHVDLVAKHRVLEHQFASGPDRVHGDGCDLARLPAGCQLRPQPLDASQEPGPDAGGARQTHPSLGTQTVTGLLAPSLTPTVACARGPDDRYVRRGKRRTICSTHASTVMLPVSST